MTPSKLEEQMSQLLHNYADAAMAHIDVGAAVQQRLAQQEPEKSRHLRFPLGASLSAAVVIVLLVSTFTWLQHTSNHGVGGTSGVSSTATTAIALSPLPTHPLAQSPTIHGITLYVEQVYADTTRTALHFALGGDQAQSPTSQAATPIIMITDSKGRIAAGAYGFSGTPLRGGSDWYTEVAPLDPAALGSTQELTLTVLALLSTDLAHPAPIKGPWKATFTIATAAAKTTSLTTAPIVHNGLSIQSTLVSWSHASTQIDGHAGGVRVQFHVTGLPTAIKDASSSEIAFKFNPPGWNGADGENAGNDTWQITLPGGATQVPAMALPVRQVVGPNGLTTAQINPDGSLDLEIIFLLDPLPSSKALSLTLNQLTLSYVSRNGSSQSQVYTGPWEFQVPVI